MLHVDSSDLLASVDRAPTFLTGPGTPTPTHIHAIGTRVWGLSHLFLCIWCHIVAGICLYVHVALWPHCLRDESLKLCRSQPCGLGACVRVCVRARARACTRVLVWGVDFSKTNNCRLLCCVLVTLFHFSQSITGSVPEQNIDPLQRIITQWRKILSL